MSQLRQSVFLLLLPLIAFANVPSDLEADFAEAVIEYNNRNFPGSLEILNRLLKRSPETIEFLELKALALKTQKKDGSSLKTYLALVEAKKKQGAEVKDIAPYQFEIGMIYFRNKRLKRAQKPLRLASRAGFNKGVAEFVLGNIAFQRGSYHKAERHLKASIRSKTPSTLAASHFYLAQTYQKLRYTIGSTDQLRKARRVAKEDLQNPGTDESTKAITKAILNASEKALRPLDRGKWFASATLTGGYDSNVLSLPEGITDSSTTALGKATPIVNLGAGVGHMTTPLGFIQWIPNYRFQGNYNFNRVSRSAEYITNSLSNYFVRDPLSEFSYGLKLDANHLFNNQGLDSSQNFDFKSYVASGTIGPYFKWQPSRNLTLGAEATGAYQIFFGDSTLTTDSTKRSGLVLTGRSFLQLNLALWFFNPNFSVMYRSTETTGTEFDAGAFTAQLMNRIDWMNRLSSTLGLIATFTQYPNRESSVREDILLIGMLNSQFQLTKKFSILLNIQATRNESNLPSDYAFDRIAANAGVTYSFF